MRRPRLLAVGQALNASGYARVMESLLPRLAATFDVVLFAPNRHGQPLRRDGVTVLGSTILGDPYGRVELPRVLAQCEPDVVLVQVDAVQFGMHADALREHPGPVVAYCPIDWPQLPDGVGEALDAVDRIVVYTEFGRRVLGRDAEVVPHGVDTATFRPMPGARDDGEFLVLNANRNLRRKRVDLTLEGFALFARDRPRARLHLHMGVRDGGVNVLELAERLGIADRVTLTPHDGRRPHVSDAELNAIYNRAHVGINTCEAEGFGLVAFEHAATGAPQVVPDHSACGELWRDHALLLPPEPTPHDVAAALSRLHDDAPLRDEMSRRAHERARDPSFGWDAIAARWAEVLGREAEEERLLNGLQIPSSG